MKISRLIAIGLVGVQLVSASGCAKHHLRVPNPNPATDYESTTMHAYFWGALESEKIAENCVDNALDEVQVGTNWGYSLAGVITLGMWMPVDVSWKCAKRPASVGTIP